MVTPEPGQAVCEDDDCDWSTTGPNRFHDAVKHREETGHQRVPASLSDAPGDDTGARVGYALRGASAALRGRPY